MGLLDSITGAIVLRYKAETDQAKAKIRELSGEQKKAAKEAADALEAQGKAADGLSAKWAKGAAVIAGTYLVARDGLKAYRDDVRLTAGAAGVDIDSLSDAYDGLRTRTELLTLAQAGHQGAWKLTTAQIEQVIGGMRALEKKGFDSQQVFEKFTDIIKKGKLEGLDDFGISLKATGDQTQDLKVLMNALGREVLDVGGNFEMAGDATTRATTRMVDGVTRVRVIVGEATNALIDMAASFGEGWGQAIFGNLPQDVGTGGRADVYAQRFSGLRGATVNDPNKIRIGNQKGADFLFAQPKDADIAAAKTLANFKTALNKGMQGWGPLATTSPEEFAKIVAGLPEDWRLVDAGLAKSVDAMQAKLQARFNTVGVEAAQGILVGFKNALSKNRSDVARSRGGGGGGRAADLGPGLFFGATDWVGDAVDRLAGLEDARAAGAAASRSRLDALGNAGMQTDLDATKAALQQFQDELAGVMKADELNAADRESFLSKIFGPLDEFDAYGESLTLLGDITKATWGAIVSTIANGEELSAKQIRKAIGSVLAAKAQELGADGLIAVLRGVYDTATGDVRGPGKIAAGSAMMAGALTIAAIASKVGGGSAAPPSRPGTSGGGSAGGARTNAGPGSPGAGQGWVVLGGAFEDYSPRQRARQIYRALNNVQTAYQPPGGSS